MDKKVYDTFKAPGVEWRGKPFWAWNGDLKKEELIRQVDVMKKMGFGGYFMHSRCGLITEYLGDEWFELTNAVADADTKAGMENWLYDEDRWPSGAAGGIITRDHQYRARHLCFTPVQQQNGRLLARYAIALDEKKCLKSYRLLQEGEEAGSGELLRYAYLCISGDDPWFNNQAYLDTLSPQGGEKIPGSDP